MFGVILHLNPDAVLRLYYSIFFVGYDITFNHAARLLTCISPNSAFPNYGNRVLGMFLSSIPTFPSVHYTLNIHKIQESEILCLMSDGNDMN